MDTAPVSFAIDPQSFQQDVVERSNQQPVLLLFWAEQVPPSVQAKQMLETLVAGYQGKVLLAHSDVALDQALAQHLRVQGLPAVRVVDKGQIVDQMDGPTDETKYRELLDRLTMSSAESLQQQLALLLEGNQFEPALALLQQAIDEEPKNMSFRVELADVLVLQGNLEDARTVLAGIPADTDDRARPQNRLEFVEEAAALPSLEDVEKRLAANEADLEARYERAVHAAAANDFEGALANAMVILQKDREFRDDLGRLTMLRIFSLMGKGSEVATAWRRRMFNFMH